MFLRYLGFCSSTHTSSSQRRYPTVVEELCHQFSLKVIRKSTNNFDEKRLIEWGAVGKVYKGCLQHNAASDYTVAIKRLHETRFQRSEEFKNEIELLCQLHHPNLISLIGFCNHKTERILVYEYMSNGSLDDHLLRRRGDVEALSWKKRLEICIGAARGLHYLHAGVKRTIINCSIHPRSILLDDHMQPKLTGFGLSQKGPRFMSKPKPVIVDCIKGTYGYVAMEYAIHGILTDKCDVYSFGIVLLQVVCGRTRLHEIEDPIKHVEEIIDPDIKGNIAPECWELYIDIIQRCIKLEPEERPTMGEVEVQLEHALLLQEQADIRNTNSHYTLLSTTIIKMGWELESNYNFISSDTEDSDKY